MAEFKDRLNEAMELRDLKPAELAKLSGVNEGAISQYRKGAYKAGQHNLDKLAYVLKVSIPWLMGADVPMDQSVASGIDIENDCTFPSNLTPLQKMQKIPLVGRIACGEPILAEQHIEEFIDLPKHIRADFALECHGDSMVGANIHDGDIVYIRMQPQVENGQIAAVIIGGEEATLKRFYRNCDTVTLAAENPAFPPLVFVGSEINDIRVVGRAIAFTHVI